jgi:hypothetical protein
MRRRPSDAGSTPEEHHVLRDSITRAERLRSVLGVLVVVP